MKYARGTIRLGDIENLGKPNTPDFMLNAVNRVFDKRRWILRKTVAGQLREYTAPVPEWDEKTI